MQQFLEDNPDAVIYFGTESAISKDMIEKEESIQTEWLSCCGNCSTISIRRILY